jgi:hypothetical protein
MVWARLKAWLFGESEDDGSEAETADEGGEAYACAVCGTAVDDPGGACPLCGSTDIETPGATEPAGPAPESKRVSGGDTDPAEALRRTRENLLSEHEEKWEHDGDGYRVEGADGEWRRVETEDELREALRGR